MNGCFGSHPGRRGLFICIMDLKIFEENGFKIRSIRDNDNNSWFVLSDVCKALNLSNTSKVKQRLDKDGCRLIDVNELLDYDGFDSVNIGNPYMTFINEDNFYRCIMKSDKKEAEVFQDWLCDEVLPSIRKSKYYMKEISDEEAKDIISRALELAKDVLKRREERLRKSSNVNICDDVLFND